MGQVQSRQEESYFKAEGADKDALLNKYTELASAARGGKVLETSDELFGESFHLIKEDAAIEDKNRETANGFWKDGWESRRHNKDSHHTAIIQLGAPGTIAGFDIDTSFFDGSHPAYASIEACEVVEGVKGKEKYQARLRVYGKVTPIFPKDKTVFNLASFSHGARVIKSSDDRYGKPSNIILPTKGHNTRDGWQTRRSRDPDHHDWVEIKLGATGILETLIVDTTHFRGNNPDFISLDACTSEYNDVQYDPEVKWTNLLTKTAIEGDKKNTFTIKSAKEDVSYTHVRLNIFPDGGISRVHVLGVRVPEPIELAVEALKEEEKVAEQVAVVDELKVVETETVAKSTPATKASKAPKATKASKKEVAAVVIEQKKEEIVIDVTTSKGTTELTSEISSVSTLVDETELTTPTKKGSAATKRGRPSKAAAAATAVVAATKLASGAGSKKKAKGRSASVLDEDDEATSEVSVSASPRSKKARE
ncbi:Allantoicase [Gryganskiella cystojenkinii]|nr:Allantoicase [Gryganskiella cystojenkinii]